MSDLRFALRSADGLYWNGVCRRYRNVRPESSKWKVRLSQEPTYWAKSATAVKKWHRYEAERLCGNPIPKLCLISVEMMPVERAIAQPEPQLGLIVRERFLQGHGFQAVWAFEHLLRSCGEDLSQAAEYRYLVTRRGGKTLMDERMRGVVTYGPYTFVKTDTDLVTAKMLLNDMFARYHDIAPYYVIEEPPDGR
jgi:hypothetical protein